jgi:EF hand
MTRIGTLAAAFLLGTVVGGSAAKAQTTTVPNAGAGVPTLPWTSAEQLKVTPDQSSVPGLLGNQSVPVLQQRTGLQDQAQGNQEEEGQDGFFHGHRGMMGMMGRGFGHHGSQQAPGVVHETIMRVIFSLMDADGDGKLSLQEWQSAHERIFKAMDTNHDGAVTFEEMQTFMHGRGQALQ